MSRWWETKWPSSALAQQRNLLAQPAAGKFGKTCGSWVPEISATKDVPTSPERPTHSFHPLCAGPARGQERPDPKT